MNKPLHENPTTRQKMIKVLEKMLDDGLQPPKMAGKSKFGGFKERDLALLMRQLEREHRAATKGWHAYVVGFKDGKPELIELM